MQGDSSYSELLGYPECGKYVLSLHLLIFILVFLQGPESSQKFVLTITIMVGYLDNSISEWR